jgi:hypothetical protein
LQNSEQEHAALKKMLKESKEKNDGLIEKNNGSNKIIVQLQANIKRLVYELTFCMKFMDIYIYI